MKKWLGFIPILLLGVFLWNKFHKVDFPKTPITQAPKETQYFCMSLEKGIPAAVIRLDWRVGNFALWSFNNSPPSTTGDLKTTPPDLEASFTKNENILSFQNLKKEEASVNLLDFNALNNLPQIVVMDGRNFTLKECPWNNSSEVYKIKELFTQGKISILCYTDPNNLTSSIYMLDFLNGIYKIWGTDQLSGWEIFTEQNVQDGTLINEKNSIGFEDALGKVNTFSITKRSQNQIQELKANNLILSQEYCPFLSSNLTTLMKNKELLYCLKPKILKPVSKNQNPEKDETTLGQETITSVLSLDIKNKSFIFYGSFSGNKAELLQPPTASGTISQKENHLILYNKEGKEIHKGTLINNALNFGELEFKNEYCSF